jgi:hypothetical protein
MNLRELRVKKHRARANIPLAPKGDKRLSHKEKEGLI